MEDKPFPLYGDGYQVRDWLYVLDHAKAIVLLIEKGCIGEIYNIGGTCALFNRKLAEEVLDLMGKPHTLLERVPDRPGHDRRYALNCDKLANLGWRPETLFAEALQETIRWYQTRVDWWRPLKVEGSFKKYYQQQYVNRSEEALEKV